MPTLLLFIVLSIAWASSQICQQSTTPNPFDPSLRSCESLARSTSSVNHVVMEVDGNTASEYLSLWEETEGESKAGQFVVVLVYAPWCPFSRLMSPMYAELSSLWPEVPFLRLDGSTTWEFAARFMIRGFPSLLVFRRGKLASYYDGPRTVEDLTMFLHNHTVPLLTPQSHECQEHEHLTWDLWKEPPIYLEWNWCLLGSLAFLVAVTIHALSRSF